MAEKKPIHQYDVRIKELDSEIESREEALSALQDEAQKLKDERARDLSPFKPGDRVRYRNKEFEVSRVTDYCGDDFEVHAWNVLKNGKAGNRESTLYFTEHIQKIAK